MYGIRHLSIDGQMSFQQRAKVVKMFAEEPEYRVLIMSSVGSVGLNLTVASAIIFLVRTFIFIGEYYFITMHRISPGARKTSYKSVAAFIGKRKRRQSSATTSSPMRPPISCSRRLLAVNSI